LIKELIEKILEKLKASTDLQGIFWHYGEPIEFTRADKGEGYVSLVPLERQFVEPLMRGNRHTMRLFIVITYRNINEEKCDQWVHEKTEKIWEIIQANNNWDGLVIESHLEDYTFLPGKEEDYTFDKMFNRIKCDIDIFPS
jgi:hypothetical protein